MASPAASPTSGSSLLLAREAECDALLEEIATITIDAERLEAEINKQIEVGPPCRLH